VSAPDAPGDYVVELALADSPERTLSRMLVRVGARSREGADSGPDSGR